MSASLTKAVTRVVKPVDGRRVRDPDDPKHRPLPAEGKLVIWSAYWHRLKVSGDIEILDAVADPPKAAAPAPPPPSPPVVMAPPAAAPPTQAEAKS